MVYDFVMLNNKIVYFGSFVILLFDNIYLYFIIVKFIYFGILLVYYIGFEII